MAANLSNIPFALNITWLEINGIVSQRSREQRSRFFREGYAWGEVEMGECIMNQKLTKDGDASSGLKIACCDWFAKDQLPNVELIGALDVDSSVIRWSSLVAFRSSPVAAISVVVMLSNQS